MEPKIYNDLEAFEADTFNSRLWSRDHITDEGRNALEAHVKECLILSGGRPVAVLDAGDLFGCAVLDE